MPKYSLVSDKIRGTITAEYLNGTLTCIELELHEHLLAEQVDTLFNKLLAYKESDLIKGRWQLIEVAPTNKKIALFCEQYAFYNKGVKYRVRPKEAGMIANVEVTQESCNCYFRSKNFLFHNKHSIANYVKYYNELRAEMAGAHRFPNYYSKDFAGTISDKEYMDYIKYLKSIGYVTKMRGNEMIDMVYKSEVTR